MHLAMLVEMIESGFSDRALLEGSEGSLTGADVASLSRRGAATVEQYDAIVYAGENHPLLPIALLSAAVAGIPFVPVNYRLEDQKLNELIARQRRALVLSDHATSTRIDGAATTLDGWLAGLPNDELDLDMPLDDDAVAVVLYTSGTTSEPKSALLRHRHLMAYLLGTVEFGSALPDEAVLIAVPPYHVAGVANMLSNLFAGRRLVYLTSFDAAMWLETVRRESVTNAMVVPTMLARIVDAIGGGSSDLPSLRTLSYGGAKVSERVVTQALRLLPSVNFVNAYGLTETASTIAVLGPEDHRAALEAGSEVIKRRLSSAGQVVPNVEIEIRNADDQEVRDGEVGMIYLRGDQISGEYSTGTVLDADGWFCTRDRGSVDEGGYLFIEGRADDTIIRGGENIAPAEIEEVLLAEPGVAEACVVGIPDDEWGQRIVAVVVPMPGAEPDPTALQSAVRSRLRGARTPDTIVFRQSLPHTETGKLLRRVVLEEMKATVNTDA